VYELALYALFGCSEAEIKALATKIFKKGLLPDCRFDLKIVLENAIDKKRPKVASSAGLPDVSWCNIPK
jgi:hypothetical protein